MPGRVIYAATEGEGIFRIGTVESGCSTWSHVIAEYNAYVGDTGSWTDVITCYNGYVSHK